MIMARGSCEIPIPQFSLLSHANSSAASELIANHLGTTNVRKSIVIVACRREAKTYGLTGFCVWNTRMYDCHPGLFLLLRRPRLHGLGQTSQKDAATPTLPSLSRSLPLSRAFSCWQQSWMPHQKLPRTKGPHMLTRSSKTEGSSFSYKVAGNAYPSYGYITQLSCMLRP